MGRLEEGRLRISLGRRELPLALGKKVVGCCEVRGGGGVWDH